MAEFLDTTAISYNLERLLKTAQERIILISPYLKFRPRIRELIEDARCRKIRVQVVYGKSERCDEIKYLRAFKDVSVIFCKTVHAKCYLNEQGGIITSLNLYDFSEAKNYEMGVMFRRSSDPELFRRALDEAERIIRISGGESTDVKSALVEKSLADHPKLTTAKLATKVGILTTVLFDKLIGGGYLELRDGGKRYLTPKGKGAGGEFRMGKGPYFIWPPDLRID
jgi:phosphatidylserine/phosphatidylglycerophosphate/cardiolipin synthase-like enzyme